MCEAWWRANAEPEWRPILFSDPSQARGANAFDARFQRTPDIELASSGGALRWLYAIGAPRVTSAHPTWKERELLRRGRLAATLITAILVLGIIGLPIGAFNPSKTAVLGDALGVLGCVIALALNRSGAVAAASILLAALLNVGFAGIMLTSAGGLSVYNLLLAPLLTTAELIAVSLLVPWSVFLVALLNSLFLTFVIFNMPTDPTVHAIVSAPGGSSLILGPLISLYMMVALVTFLWVRGANDALTARDRAEELAQLEHAVAEQRRSLEVGMRQMHDTLVRVANGDYTARAPMDRNNVLWQLSASLNTMIARQQKVGDAQYLLQRTAAEVARLTEAVREARLGRPPLWPAETGTLLDPLIRELAGPRPPSVNPSMLPGSGQYGGIASIPGLGMIPGLTDGGIPGPNAIPGPGPAPQLPPGWEGPFHTEPRLRPDSLPLYPPTRGAPPPDQGYPDQGYPDQDYTNPRQPNLNYPDQGSPDQPYPDLGDQPQWRDW
jgi:hypothetical protein